MKNREQETKSLQCLQSKHLQAQMVRAQLRDLTKARLLPKALLKVRGLKKMIFAEACRRAEVAASCKSIREFNKLVNKGVKRVGRVKLTPAAVLSFR